MKHFLEMQNFEDGGKLSVRTVEPIKISWSYLKWIKEGLKDLQKVGALTSEIIKMQETFLESHKIPIKMTEKVSPEIGEILEKLDKPASLLELGLERVHGLGLILQGTSMEQLPVTLKTQVEHWPNTRDSRIREKMAFLVQAVDRIENIMPRV